jgi:hypothetical protein
VLGLRWETAEKEEISVDVKINYGANLPNCITRRALWKVAQSQYDPLGLLCLGAGKEPWTTKKRENFKPFSKIWMS